ncbi:MAG TPA: hypothetical protein VIT42_09725 [Microlunatus sp.]
MFAQVIQGKVSDATAARAALERWVSTLSADASEWLGSTAGVTDDGTLIMVARFGSAEAAQRNSDRPEQGDWWAETAKLFDGEPTFDNSTEVDVDVAADPDASEFVQIMRGQMSDPARARELMQQDPEVWQNFRPDILGTVTAVHEGGRYTSVIYFNSESEAREGESKEVPAELQSAMEEMGSVYVGETEYLDLKDPWLHSPS